MAAWIKVAIAVRSLPRQAVSRGRLLALAGRVCACERRPFRRRAACRTNSLLHPRPAKKSIRFICIDISVLRYEPRVASNTLDTIRRRTVEFVVTNRESCALAPCQQNFRHNQARAVQIVSAAARATRFRSLPRRGKHAVQLIFSGRCHQRDS